MFVHVCVCLNCWFGLMVFFFTPTGVLISTPNERSMSPFWKSHSHWSGDLNACGCWLPTRASVLNWKRVHFCFVFGSSFNKSAWWMCTSVLKSIWRVLYNCYCLFFLWNLTLNGVSCCFWYFKQNVRRSTGFVSSLIAVDVSWSGCFWSWLFLPRLLL